MLSHPDQAPPPVLTPADAARMYHRVLTAWAMDALALRRLGLDVPTHRVDRASYAPSRRDRSPVIAGA
jgi:hypothetical protein